MHKTLQSFLLHAGNIQLKTKHNEYISSLEISRKVYLVFGRGIKLQ